MARQQVAEGAAPPSLNQQTQLSYPSGVGQWLQNYRHGFPYPPLRPSSSLRSIDTLWVGLTPGDTVVITGTWQNTGPIILENDGVLIFNNANATIGGDMYVLDSAQVFATNSTLYFPQQYFYQRAIITVQNAQIKMTDCTLNFGNMAHNFSIQNNSSITLQNVYFTDYTTTGMGGAATFTVDSCNLLGEIVIIDSIHLNINHTDTVLLWHHVPRGDSLTWIFPKGVNLQHYGIAPDSAGVGGLKYNVQLNNGKLTQWALMPENGSTISVSNSAIQSVGALFGGTDSSTVSGLVDNSYYAASAGLFTDRNFQLNNTSVNCWSLYPMDTARVSIKSCITGEIGSSEMANTTCTSIFNDGSGGYFWSATQAMQIATLSAFTCYVRSEGAGITLVGYSSITDGLASAIDSSILFLIQTPIFAEPVAYGGADVWVLLIDPVNGYAGDTVPLTGCATILRGPNSNLMSFSSYYMQYQAVGSSTWTTIPGTFTSPVYQNTLVPWPTAGLSPGMYNVLLVLKDDRGDSTSTSAVVTLLAPEPAALQNIASDAIHIYPNPVAGQLMISNLTPGTTYRAGVYNMAGQLAATYLVDKSNNTLPVSDLSAGTYFIKLMSEHESLVRRFVKM